MQGMSKIVIVTFAFVSAWITFAQEKNDGETGEKMDVFRLPCNTRPESYDILIVPKFEGAISKFSGVTKIILLANEPTNSVTLNARNLVVNEVIFEEIEQKEAKCIKVLCYDHVKKNEQLVISLESTIEPGRKYQITITYEGITTNDALGLYMSSYNEGKEKKFCLASRLLPVNARNVFPCYDETQYKTVMNISIVKKKCQIALSNMPILCVEEIKNGAEDEELVRFEPSPMMSSHMAAFFIGEYGTSKKNSEVTVYSHGEYIKQTEYISNEAPKHIKAMKDYIGVPITLSKLDMVNVPFDSSYDCVPNWGLNFYENEYILFDDFSTTDSKIDGILTIYHVMTFSWFGDLASCKWWHSVWVQFGFAHYFRFFVVTKVEPKWPAEEWYFYKEIQSILQNDVGLPPLTQKINSPDEILDALNFITFAKGSVLFRMLRYLITEKLFHLSIQHYLNTFKYGVADADDLYSSFDKVLSDNKYELGNGLTVKEFMQNWATQPGYPYLNISRDSKANTFIITQSQFPEPDEGKESPIWYIGLTFTTQQSKNFDFCKPTYWTDKACKTTTIPAPENNGWYIFNIQASGYYRVNYDEENWMAIIKQLNDDIEVFSVLNRAVVINDAFFLARNGLLKYSVPLCLVTFLKNEHRPVVFYTSLNSIHLILNNVENDPKLTKKLKSYFGRYFEIMRKKIDDLVSKGNKEVEILQAWGIITEYTCYNLGNEDCKKVVFGWFDKWLKGEKVPNDLRLTVFQVGMEKNKDKAIFEKMFELCMSSTSFSESDDACTALGSIVDKEQLTTFMQNLIFPSKPEKSTNEKQFSVLDIIGGSPYGFETQYDFLSKNLNKIITDVPDGEKIASYIYSGLAYNVRHKEGLEQMKKLKDFPNLPPSVKTEFEAAFGLISLGEKWTYADEINAWDEKCCLL